ncbi:MAG TPA: hypothetical protein VN281_14180, partial [Verrucomicrobiae bacterium]|nr:hypothetical protein [Verrucomicrobiae bacterium]
ADTHKYITVSMAARTLTLAMPFMIATMIAINSMSQVPRISSARQLTSSADDEERPIGAAMDRQGNFFLAGSFQAPFVSFGDQTLTNLSAGILIPNWHGAVNGFVAKYTGSGSLLWVRHIGGDAISGDSALACGVDAAGNVFITGWLGSSNVWFGTNLISNVGTNFAFYVAKFDPEGNFIWAQQVAGIIGGRALAVDHAGNVHAAGSFVPTNVVFGTNYFESSALVGDFIAEYSGDGQLLWVKAVTFSGYEQSPALAVDSAGNTYFSDSFQGVADFGTVALTNSAGANGETLFLAKYDPNGNLVWANAIGTGTQVIAAEALAVGPQADCHVFGAYWYQSTATVGTNTLPPTIGQTGANGFIAKYDSAGNLAWVSTMTGSNFVSGNTLAVDPMDYCWAIGYAGGSNLDFGSGITATNADPDLYSVAGFVARYEPTGKPLWAKVLNSPGVNTEPVGVLDSTGSLSLFGLAYGTSPLDLDGIMVNGPTNGTNYFFSAKINGPAVSIQPLGGQIIISWPTNAAGLSLESAADLRSGNWSPVTNAPVIVGAQFSVTNNSSAGSQFYRLRNF